MLKLIGAILIILSSAVIGMYKINVFSERINVFQSMINICSLFKREIMYSCASVSELLSMCEGEYIEDFINIYNKQLPESEDMFTYCMDSINKAPSLKCLNEYEKNRWRNTIFQLGKSDILTQAELLDSSIKEFSDLLKLAKEDKLSRSKVCMTMYLYCGIALAILII